MNHVFYFGCIRESGHYWFEPPGASLPYRSKKIPPEFSAENIDGRLPPRKWDEGVALWTLRVRGEVWTAVAWWDNTVDKRPGSHSVLLADGTPTAGELMREGARQFPDLRARIDKLLIPVVEPGFPGEVPHACEWCGRMGAVLVSVIENEFGCPDGKGCRVETGFLPSKKLNPGLG